MKKLLIFVLIMIVANMLTAVENHNKISTQLLEEMRSSSKDEYIRVNITFINNYDPLQMINETADMEKAAKRDYVTSTLKEFTADTQVDVLSKLNQLSLENKVKNIKSIWIVNVINCEIKKSAISLIAKEDDIALIDHDEDRNILLAPEKEDSKEYLHTMKNGREITWNVTKVNADDVWALGYYGEGTIVAVLDTGVNYNHTDLNDHLWNDPNYPNHGYDFANNDDNPLDDHGHGTHCAGTVAGDGTSGSQTGMAPEATIMCVKVLDSSGNGNESSCWQAIEFAVDNGADVLSMSFGWQHSWGTNRPSWRNAMDYAYAADVFASVAAGNEGDQQSSYPIPDNVRTPGDCPPPWLHPDQTLTGGVSSVVCVGATDSNDNLAGFSGRGPVTWESITGYNDYPYNPEMGLIRPDISAPGSNIKSLDFSSNTGYASGWSGTSMATPCVAGVVALMLSKDFTLTPAQIDQIIEENVEVAQYPKNNNYGSGRIDALASVNAVPTPNTPPNAPVNPNPADNAEYVSIETDLSWMNGGGAASYEVSFGTDNPPTNILNAEPVTSSFYDLIDDLELETTYYWNINAINDFGNAVGPIWSFTTVGPPDEDFESGGFTLFPWQFYGYEISWPNANPIEDFILGNSIPDLEWSIDNFEFYSGAASAKSYPITDNQASYLSIEQDVTEPGMLSFWYKVDAEYSPSQTYFYDGLFFIIDGVTIDRFQTDGDGSSPWKFASYEIETGYHTFDWVFVKDATVSNGSDCAWIDHVNFPGVSPQPPILEINPEEFTFEVLTNNIVTDELTIENTGSGVGTYTIELDYSEDWLELDSYSGEVDSGEMDTITLTIDPDGLENGEHLCDIVITDNRNITTIPVMMTVNMVNADNIVNSNTLLGNHPNPFNPSTTVSFTIQEQSAVDITIYSIKGQKIKTLVNSVLDNGIHSVVWNGNDDKDDPVSSGVYFYRLLVNDKIESTKKMLLLK